MDIRRKQALNESPFSPTRVNVHWRRAPPLRDLLTACGNRTNYVPASTRGGGVEDIKISRQLSADAEKETEGAIRSAVGTCVTCIQLLRTDSECGSTVRAMDWTRTGLGGRRGLRRRAAGERAGYLVTSRGGGAYVAYAEVESQNRTTTGLRVRALAQVLVWTSRTDDQRRACVHIIKEGPCEDLFVVSARWIISFRLSSPVYDLA